MRDDLAASGIGGEHAGELGFRPVDADEIELLVGFRPTGLAEGYAIPFVNPENGQPFLTPDGRPYVRVKLREPVIIRGNSAKYLSPISGGQHAFITPDAHAAFKAGARVSVTEGEKKAACASTRGIPTIGLVGNWGWKAPDGDLLPELARYAHPGAQWVVIWDSDASTNPAFAASSLQLAKVLIQQECTVRFVYLPSATAPDEGKIGLDDFLSAEQDGAKALQDIVASAVPIKEESDLIGALPPYARLLDEMDRLQTGAEPKCVLRCLEVAAHHYAAAKTKMRAVMREDLIRRARRLGISAPAQFVDVALESSGQEDGNGSGKGTRGPIEPDPEPWDEPVDGANLADEILEFLHNHVVAAREAMVACVLWIFFAFNHDLFDCSPILAVDSPEKRCGKTRLLELLDCLLPRVLFSSNASLPSLYRLIGVKNPTLVLDEVDRWGREAKLDDLLNAGWRRAGSSVVRCDGEEFEPRAFSTWCPKLIAGINLPHVLSDPALDRCIRTPLRRKRTDEKVFAWRERDRKSPALQCIRRKLVRWAADMKEVELDEDPVVPEGLNDRAADNWAPLIAIADHVGGQWPGLAREAASSLSKLAGESAGDSLPTELLADIREILNTLMEDPIPTKTLTEQLINLEERPWSEVNKGRPMTQRTLAGMLKPFGIKTGDAKCQGKTLKCYVVKDFNEVFQRYLPDGCATHESGATESATTQPFPDEEVMQPVAPVADDAEEVMEEVLL